MAKAASSNWRREPFRFDEPDVEDAAPPPPLLRAKYYQPRPKAAQAAPRRATIATHASAREVSPHPMTELKGIVHKLLVEGAGLGGDAPAMGERWVHQYLDVDVGLRNRLGDELITQCVRTLVARALTEASTLTS